MTIFFSRKANGFFDTNINKSMPDDVVKITKERHSELLSLQSSSRVISGDDDGFPIIIDHIKTNEEIILEKEAKIKQRIISLTVTTGSGNKFKADEISQYRMAKTIICLDSGGATPWKLLNNNWGNISKEELKEALKLAVQAQTIILQAS